MESNKPYAFFTQDEVGEWGYQGIHNDKEAVLALVERFKHGPNIKQILVIELSTGHKAYEWSAT